MTQRARRGELGVTRHVMLLVVVAVLAAACGGAPDGDASPGLQGHGTPTTVPSADGTSPDDGASATASNEPAGETKVVGSAESVGDVGSQDRTPMTDRTLLVLPRAEADRLWDLIEHVPSDSELPYVGGLLDRSDVEQWQLAPIDDGRFGLDAPDGDYLVCLLSGEFILNGCADATVAGSTTWAVAHGEGGFEIRR